jgi:general secretion pathway protein A
VFEDFYGLSAPPFALSPDHRFFYGSESHRKAMAYLDYGLQQGEGFIVVTGAVGTGKSTLASQLFSTLDRERIVAAQIANTQVEADDALRFIVSAFGVRAPSPDKAALLHALQDFLATQHGSGRRVLLVVDEAQNLPRRTLEELRMLSNFAVDGEALFQCFLLGQPQFRTLLADPGLEQLRQRVIASVHLTPLVRPETREYVEHRLRTVGWSGSDPEITDDIYDRLHAETGGVPRRINMLMGRLLLYGALEGLHRLDGDAIEAVVADLHEEATDVAPVVVEHRAVATRPGGHESDAARTPTSAAAASAGEVEEMRGHLRRLEEANAEQRDLLRLLVNTLSDYLSALLVLQSVRPSSEADAPAASPAASGAETRP